MTATDLNLAKLTLMNSQFTYRVADGPAVCQGIIKSNKPQIQYDAGKKEKEKESAKERREKGSVVAQKHAREGACR
eukprot:SAG31_NODE_1471_length_8213_cov_71.355065_5_plen_76_part_00